MSDIQESLPRRLSSTRARNIAESLWGRGGTHSIRTNTAGAFFYDCSGHGGYVVDGAILTSDQRRQIDRYIKPHMVSAVVRGDEVDLMMNPFGFKSRRYPIRPGQQIVKHPLYVFEHDADFLVLERFTDIRRNHCTIAQQSYDREVRHLFEFYHGIGKRIRGEGHGTFVKAQPAAEDGVIELNQRRLLVGKPRDVAKIFKGLMGIKFVNDQGALDEAGTAAYHHYLGRAADYFGLEGAHAIKGELRLTIPGWSDRILVPANASNIYRARDLSTSLDAALEKLNLRVSSESASTPKATVYGDEAASPSL